MKCKYCGAEISDNVKFCTECGQKIQRKRSIIDPFPELDEFRRIRNRIYMVDEHSKPLNIYCYVMIVILVVALVVSLILKVKFLSVTALFFIGVLLLMLWANNRNAGKIRFGIVRILVVAIPILTIQAIVMAMFMSGTDNSFNSTFFEKDFFKTSIATFEAKEGWKLSYDTEKFSRNDDLGDGKICFNYIGECSGTTAVLVSYIPEKLPDEVLYEKTADIDDSRITRGESYFGRDMYWAHFRHIKPENEDPNVGDVVYEGFTAIEHNGGTVLIDSIEHEETNDKQYSDIENAMSELINSFELIDHKPQTEYAYIPGHYMRSYVEEFEGENVEITESVDLKDDHTCEVTFQDTILGEWTGTKLILSNYEELEFSVEGDSLFLNMNGEWVEFNKNR